MKKLAVRNIGRGKIHRIAWRGNQFDSLVSFSHNLEHAPFSPFNKKLFNLFYNQSHLIPNFWNSWSLHNKNPIDNWLHPIINFYSLSLNLILRATSSQLYVAYALLILEYFIREKFTYSFQIIIELKIIYFQTLNYDNIPLKLLEIVNVL